MEATTPHAVRWITGRCGLETLYTKWHYTTDANFTACQRPIVVMDEFDHKLPDTDDDLDRVDCRLCRQRAADFSGPFDGAPLDRLGMRQDRRGSGE